MAIFNSYVKLPEGIGNNHPNSACRALKSSSSTPKKHVTSQQIPRHGMQPLGANPSVELGGCGKHCKENWFGMLWIR